MIIALFLTMLTCIVLGMGVPTTANYIIMPPPAPPILVNGMGINKIAANMFVFYFGIVADITPPVAWQPMQLCHCQIQSHEVRL